jgi:predicted transcriptional regulator
MSKTDEFDFETPLPIIDEEDEETLAAIDEGIRDIEAGRFVSAEEARLQLQKWITTSSTRKKP